MDVPDVQVLKKGEVNLGVSCLWVLLLSQPNIIRVRYVDLHYGGSI